jgi:RNA ligase
MNEYRLSYEDACAMVEEYNGFNFSKTDHMIDGYKISTFTYFLCTFDHYDKPIKRRPEVQGYEMRGVTFVFNLDGTLYKRFLMLRKFFNLNQVETSQYGMVKDKEIKAVTVKEDGSLIAFMNLPDGRVFCKTQGGFTNDQSLAAMDIYENDEYLKEFVNLSLTNDSTPLFEYVAFDNRIVLQYKGRALKLIGIRHNYTEEYTNASTLMLTMPPHLLRLPHAESFACSSLDELITLAKTIEGVEGWVIEFTDGTMIKVKS